MKRRSLLLGLFGLVPGGAVAARLIEPDQRNGPLAAVPRVAESPAIHPMTLRWISVTPRHPDFQFEGDVEIGRIEVFVNGAMHTWVAASFALHGKQITFLPTHIQLSVFKATDDVSIKVTGLLAESRPLITISI